MIQVISENWSWTGLDPVEICETNLFGNIIVKSSDGTYWRIIPEELECNKIANNLEEFNAVWSDSDFKEDWEMKNLVELAKNAVGELNEGQKYCLKIPGVLGGTYTQENLGKKSFAESITFSGDTAYKIKDLPEGTDISFVVENKT